MIPISKPALAPAVLNTRGKTQIRAMSAAFTRSPASYLKGEKKFAFESGIYGHKSVKEVLIKAQHGKCFLCESKVTHVAHGDVEHFRPKGGYRQKESDEMAVPGYYWLAYEWSNLFFACQICNQKFKKNLFPLSNPAKRAVSHRDDVLAEKPHFINPADEDPLKFISFRKEIPFALKNNRRAKATIKLLGLDRPELNELRFDRYRMLKALFSIARLGIPESADARAFLDDAVKDEAEFSSMARAGVAAKFSLGP